DPIQLEDGIRIAGPGAALVALSQNGSLLYEKGQAMSYLVRVGAGRESRLLEEPRAFRAPRFSPDGRKIAVEVDEAKGNNIWVYDLAGGTFTLLNAGNFPEWSGDGKRVLFSGRADGKLAAWWKPADRSAQAEKVYQPDDVINEVLLSPDDKWLVFR